MSLLEKWGLIEKRPLSQRVFHRYVNQPISIGRPMSSADIQAAAFTDDNLAREAIEALMWPNSPVCAHCGCAGKIGRIQGKSARPGLYYCGDCKKQFTVTVGTIRASKPLSKWWFAIHLLAASKKGMSSNQLSEDARRYRSDRVVHEPSHSRSHAPE